MQIGDPWIQFLDTKRFSMWQDTNLFTEILWNTSRNLEVGKMIFTGHHRCHLGLRNHQKQKTPEKENFLENHQNLTTTTRSFFDPPRGETKSKSMVLEPCVAPLGAPDFFWTLLLSFRFVSLYV